MRKEELDALIEASPLAKYTYFIKKVVDNEEVWGLYNDGWVTTQSEEGQPMIPFWPKEEFAHYFATDEWQGASPEVISLQEFIEEWLPGMAQDGVTPSIFWTSGHSIAKDIDELLSDIENELEEY